MMPQPYHTAGGRGSRHRNPTSGCRNQGAVHWLRVQGAGSRVRGYCTLKRKKAASSAGANSRQMLPSTTDKDSGVIAEQL